MSPARLPHPSARNRKRPFRCRLGAAVAGQHLVLRQPGPPKRLLCGLHSCVGHGRQAVQPCARRGSDLRSGAGCVWGRVCLEVAPVGQEVRASTAGARWTCLLTAPRSRPLETPPPQWACGWWTLAAPPLGRARPRAAWRSTSTARGGWVWHQRVTCRGRQQGNACDCLPGLRFPEQHCDPSPTGGACALMASRS